MGILIRKRKTETVTVTCEVARIHKPRREAIVWCRECAGETHMLLPEEAAALAGVSTREIYRRVESGDLHFTEINMGSLFICRNSIARQASEAKNEWLT